MQSIHSVRNYVINGMVEIGVLTFESLIFILVPKSLALKLECKPGKEIDNGVYHKLLTWRGSFDRGKCAGCANEPTMYDRGIPLCAMHERKQERLVAERLELPAKPVSTKDKEVKEEADLLDQILPEEE